MYSDKLSNYHEDGSGSAIIVKNMKVNSLDGSIVRSQFQKLNANTNILRSLDDIDTTINYDSTGDIGPDTYNFIFNFKFKSDISINTITIKLLNTNREVLISQVTNYDNDVLSTSCSLIYKTVVGTYIPQAIINSASTPELTDLHNYVRIYSMSTYSYLQGRLRPD
jgi:hypothetical protein